MLKKLFNTVLAMLGTYIFHGGIDGKAIKLHHSGALEVRQGLWNCLSHQLILSTEHLSCMVTQVLDIA